MIALLLLAAIGLSIAGLAVYALRIDLVYKIRMDALEVVHARAKHLLYEAGESLLPDGIAELEAAIDEQWAIMGRHSHGAMLLALTKWTFKQFYPDLADELAARRERSTLE